MVQEVHKNDLTQALAADVGNAQWYTKYTRMI